MIRECWHDKIKRTHIDNFKYLVRKHSGYHHNHQENLEGCPPNSCLTTTTNVFQQASHSTTTTGETTTTNSTTATTTTTLSTSSASSPSNNPAAPSNNNQKWVINLSKTPLSLAQTSLLSRDQILQLHPNTP